MTNSIQQKDDRHTKEAVEGESSLEKVAVLQMKPLANQEVEMALLGAILRNNHAFEGISDFLEATHFYAPEHQVIYGHIKRLLDAGNEVKPTILQHVIADDEMLQAIGGADYLRDLASNVVTIINVKQYGEIIQDLYLKREMVGVHQEGLAQIYATTDDINSIEQIETTESKLSRLAETGQVGQGPKFMSQLVGPVLANIEAIWKRDGALSGVSTGFPTLDAFTGGLQRGNLITLAARPAMGKTTLGLNIAEAASLARPNFDNPTKDDLGAVLLFSKEMTQMEVVKRLLATKTGIPVQGQNRGDLGSGGGADGYVRLANAADGIKDLKLLIDDGGDLTVTTIRQRARRVQRQYGLKLVIIDHLGLVPPVKEDANRSKVEQVTNQTRALKNMAKELDVPVLLLSQLSRAVENREDKRPQLADLRESGSIEQDSNCVWFIYREEYYLSKSEPQRRSNEGDEKFHDRHNKWIERMTEMRGISTLIVAKQRDAPMGDLEFGFDGAKSKFYERGGFNGTFETNSDW